MNYVHDDIFFFSPKVQRGTAKTFENFASSEESFSS
jgi:hypothetical protein